MEPISRRRFLQASAVGGAIALVPVLAGCADEPADSSTASTTAAAKAPRIDEAAFRHRGYSVLTLTPEAATCDFWGIDGTSLTEAQLPEERWLAGWQTAKGTHRLTETDAPQP